jgi:hypothetical protein
MKPDLYISRKHFYYYLFSGWIYNFFIRKRKFFLRKDDYLMCLINFCFGHYCWTDNILGHRFKNLDYSDYILGHIKNTNVVNILIS